MMVISCSYKGETQGEHKSELQSDEPHLLDSDGDLDPDFVEKNNGTDPFMANIPIFKGEYFQELKIITHLHHPKTNQSETVSLQVKKNVVSENGTPFEERDYLTRGTQYLVEKNALLAKRSNYNSHHFTGNISSDDIGYYAPPRLNDLKVFPFSQRVNDLSKRYELEEMEFFISNLVFFEFSRGITFTDLVFDLYWFDNSKEEFKLIDSDYPSGTYSFNSNHLIPLRFNTKNNELIRKIATTGGRFIYLKLRDFKVSETGLSYKSLLEKVLEKTVPLLYFDGEKEDVFYVGKNSTPLDLTTILDSVFREDYLVSGSRVARIKRNHEKNELMRDPFGEALVENYKFQILTNEILNTPFSFNFLPGDFITLSYLSNSSPFGLVPTYFGTRISSERKESIKTIKILKSQVEDFRINLRPYEVRFPKITIDPLLPCPDSSNREICWKYSYEDIARKGVQGLPITGIINLKINNIEFYLDDLINSKDAIFRIKNSEVIEIKLKDTILTKIPESENLSITISTIPRKKLVCEGIKICESSGLSCEKFNHNPPPCEESEQSPFFIIQDKTQKSLREISGEAFLSIEYL